MKLNEMGAVIVAPAYGSENFSSLSNFIVKMMDTCYNHF